MFTEPGFIATAAEIARLNGISEALAASHLAAIGDTPELDAAGLAIVRDAAGAEIGRVRLPGGLSGRLARRVQGGFET